MANGGGRSLQDVRSDLKTISSSVEEGNLKGGKGSPILRGGSRSGDSMKKGGGKKGKY